MNINIILDIVVAFFIISFLPLIVSGLGCQIWRLVKWVWYGSYTCNGS